MKDGLFFSASIAVAAGIVALALSLGDSPRVIIQEICERGYVLSGDDLNRLEQANGTSIGFVEETENDPAHMVMYAQVSRDLAPPSAGIFMSVTESYANIFNGKTIKMTVRARQNRQIALDEFETAYFSQTSGSTGWQRFTLTPDFADYSFEHTLRPYDGTVDLDYFGIWPGVLGDGRKMDVEMMRIDIVSGCE